MNSLAETFLIMQRRSFFQSSPQPALDLESLAIWGIVLVFSITILSIYLLKNHRRRKTHSALKKEAMALGIDKPPAQHPIIDPFACIGCGSCVRACPEGDVLGLVAGKATIINGLRCVGHGRCAVACPVEAIRVGLGDLRNREDIPNMDSNGQTNIPGLFIAGELGGLALIKNAIAQGVVVANAIAGELDPSPTSATYDVVVIGAGPAGLSAALVAKARGFNTLVLDQEKAGGTILQYPRKKLVLTQPVEVPGYGWLDKEEYTKEQLLEIWQQTIQREGLNIQVNHSLKSLEKSNGIFQIQTQAGHFLAKRVVLALGRRGTPRKLGVPGEHQSKVMYKLMDAAHYQQDHVLVVGGGDSAVEAAIALAKQPGNQVTISYRKSKLFRIKTKNQTRFQELFAAGKIRALFDSNVEAIESEQVKIRTETGAEMIPNNYVFIFAGGIPPFSLLRQIGITFGQEQNQESTTMTARTIECA